MQLSGKLLNKYFWKKNRKEKKHIISSQSEMRDQDKHSFGFFFLSNCPPILFMHEVERVGNPI